MYNQLKENSLRLIFRSDPPGTVAISGLPDTFVSMHVGPAVQVACRRGEYSHRGLAAQGDIDIIPAGTPSFWEISEKDAALILGVTPELLQTVAEQLDFEPRRVAIRNRFQMRDAQLENIAWALKAEMENGYPSVRLYRDSRRLAPSSASWARGTRSPCGRRRFSGSGAGGEKGLYFSYPFFPIRLGYAYLLTSRCERVSAT